MAGGHHANFKPKPVYVRPVAVLIHRLRSWFGAGRLIGVTPKDRRAHPRSKVLLDAEIFPIASYASIRIIGASTTGFMGITTAPLRPSHSLLFSVDEQHFHQGTVRWVKGERIGVDLNDALNILRGAADVPNACLSHQNSSHCHSVALTGRIAMGSAFHRTTALDVSQSGMRLQVRKMPEFGQHVLVRLRNRPLILATVRWRAEQMIGVEMAERIPTLRLIYGDN